MTVAHTDIINFWFEEIEPKQWWVKNPDFDLLLKERFGDILQMAASCELYGWRASAEGRLAEIIVLDQFSRNVYRDTPAAFEQDALALALTQEAITSGAHKALTNSDMRTFLLMPYMHSESSSIHQIAEKLFKEYAPQSNYEFELKHKAIIDRFGRYPHRNEILGRASTEEEIEFLKQPGSRF